MSAFDYAETKADVDELIAEFGQTMILRRYDAGGEAYDPTAGGPYDVQVVGAVIDYALGEIDGTRVLATDKKVLVAVGDVTDPPTPAHRLVVSGVEHAIVAVSTLAPAGTVVMWTLQVRR